MGECEQTQMEPHASLYGSLLNAALSMRDPSGQPLLDEALSEVVHTRDRAMTGSLIGAAGSSAAGALSDQIAYDIALVRYARCLGIAYCPSDFDTPTRGRREIERAISEQEVNLP